MTDKIIDSSAKRSPHLTRQPRQRLFEQQGDHRLSVGAPPIVEPLILAELLVQVAKIPLSTLVSETGLLAKLAVRKDDRVVTVLRIESSPERSHINSRWADSFPLPIGAAGSVLLSGMVAGERRELLARAASECRRRQRPGDLSRRLHMLAARGYCLDVGGFRTGIAAIAAPFIDPRGRVVAAISLEGSPATVVPATEGLAAELVRVATRCREFLNDPNFLSMISNPHLVAPVVTPRLGSRDKSKDSHEFSNGKSSS